MDEVLQNDVSPGKVYKDSSTQTTVERARRKPIKVPPLHMKLRSSRKKNQHSNSELDHSSGNRHKLAAANKKHGSSAGKQKSTTSQINPAGHQIAKPKRKKPVRRPRKKSTRSKDKGEASNPKTTTESPGPECQINSLSEPQDGMDLDDETPPVLIEMPTIKKPFRLPEVMTTMSELEYAQYLDDMMPPKLTPEVEQHSPLSPSSSCSSSSSSSTRKVYPSARGKRLQRRNEVKRLLDLASTLPLPPCPTPEINTEPETDVDYVQPISMELDESTTKDDNSQPVVEENIGDTTPKEIYEIIAILKEVEMSSLNGEDPGLPPTFGEDLIPIYAPHLTDGQDWEDLILDDYLDYMNSPSRLNNDDKNQDDTNQNDKNQNDNNEDGQDQDQGVDASAYTYSYPSPSSSPHTMENQDDKNQDDKNQNVQNQDDKNEDVQGEQEDDSAYAYSYPSPSSPQHTMENQDDKNQYDKNQNVQNQDDKNEDVQDEQEDDSVYAYSYPSPSSSPHTTENPSESSQGESDFQPAFVRKDEPDGENSIDYILENMIPEMHKNTNPNSRRLLTSSTEIPFCVKNGQSFVISPLTHVEGPTSIAYKKKYTKSPWIFVKEVKTKKGETVYMDRKLFNRLYPSSNVKPETKTNSIDYTPPKIDETTIDLNSEEASGYHTSIFDEDFGRMDPDDLTLRQTETWNSDPPSPRRVTNFSDWL